MYNPENEINTQCRIPRAGSHGRGSLFARALCFLLLAVLFLLTGSLSLTSSAEETKEQPSASDPVSNRDRYSAVLYDNTNGLPTPEANDIAGTNEGVLWIGSYGGLIRYDGNTFERVDSTNGLSSVVCLFVDNSQRLWIGTSDSGLYVLEQGKTRHWQKSDGMASAFVHDITSDNGNAIYAATSSGVVIVDQGMRMQRLEDERINNLSVLELKTDSEGLIYGRTADGDIFTIRDGVVETFLSQEDNTVKGINCITPDPQKSGYLYLGTSTSEVCYGTVSNGFKDHTKREVLPLSYIQNCEFINDKLWICAGNGVGTLVGDELKILENVPMTRSIGHIITDYENNLWFTSTRQGVMKIVPNAFSDIYTRYRLDPAVVNSTCMLGDRLFIATDEGLTVLDNTEVVRSVPLTSAQTALGKKFDAKDLVALLKGVRIRSIIRDSKDRLWISTWKKYGLLCYDGGGLTVFAQEDGLLSASVRTVIEGSDGSVYVVNNGGFSVIRDGKVVRSYSTESGIVNTESLTVAEGFNGEILLGSDGDGIYVIQDKVVRHVGTENGLTSDVILRIKRDRTRRIFWIVTSNSIAFMDESYNVTSINKFPYANNFDLYQNSKDEVWVLSSNGIYVLPADELIANGSIAPVFYGMSNGLPAISTANSYSELTADGELYIAGTTGVSLVNIESPFEDIANLKANVPYIEADGVVVYPDHEGHFTIPSNSRKLTVHGYVYNYSLTTPEVTYQLEGFESSDTTVNREELVPVSYTNLPGGEYRFVMTLTDSRGFGHKTMWVDIEKEKAFYEQPWFYIVIGLVFLILLFVLIRIYTYVKMSKLERQNRENLTLLSGVTEAFAKVIDMKDKYTNGHSFRVAQYTTMLARELGCDEETVERYHHIAMLHDVGKIAVPTEVLNKPGKLTDEEYHMIQSHVVQGYEVLKGINIMPELALGAQFHHERPDGKGYPNHLKGDEIPRVAQIIAVADCFDAMYSNRPYRKRMNFEKVVSIIKESSGTQLTPDVVDAFLRLVEKGEFRAPDDDGGGETENIDNSGKIKHNRPEKK